MKKKPTLVSAFTADESDSQLRHTLNTENLVEFIEK